MQEITFPTVHLNGTSKKDLCEGYENALHKVREAIAELSKIEFNSRDYYPQGNDAWGKAVEQRMGVNQKLNQVEDYLFQHVMNIHD